MYLLLATLLALIEGRLLLGNKSCPKGPYNKYERPYHGGNKVLGETVTLYGRAKPRNTVIV